MCVVGGEEAGKAHQRTEVTSGCMEVTELENKWLLSCNLSLPLAVAPWLCT